MWVALQPYACRRISQATIWIDLLCLGWHPQVFGIHLAKKCDDESRYDLMLLFLNYISETLLFTSPFQTFYLTLWHLNNGPHSEGNCMPNHECGSSFLSNASITESIMCHSVTPLHVIRVSSDRREKQEQHRYGLWHKVTSAPSSVITIKGL